MPNVQHSTLGTTELHEPKDVWQASAGEAYIADGAGSGEWTGMPFGWGYYAGNTTPQTVTSTPALLQIDATGALSTTDHLPHDMRGSSFDLWDSTNFKMTPRTLYDAYSIRVDLPVTAEVASPTELTVDLDIGGAATPTTSILKRYTSAGKSTPYTWSFSMPLICLTNTTLTNGIQFFVSTDTGNLTITDPAILIVKTYPGGF